MTRAVSLTETPPRRHRRCIPPRRSFRDLRPGRHAWRNVKKVFYFLLVIVAALVESPAIQLCLAILILAAVCVEIIDATSLP